ncbi:hypothetical protein ZWY2020_016847 [Hordeum vulgare]|nr:hypothetical protein ZWY2020_016847 [Hordeum vulgare]
MRPPLRRLPSLLLRGVRRHLPLRPNLLPRRRPRSPSFSVPGASFSSATAFPSPPSPAYPSPPAATVAVPLRTVSIAAVFAKHPCRIPNSFVSCTKSQKKRYSGIRVSPRVLAHPPVVCAPRRGMAALSSWVGDCSASGRAPQSIEDGRDDDNNLDCDHEEATGSFFDSFGQRKKMRLMEESNKKRKRYGGEAQGNQPPFDGSQDDPMPLPNPMVGFNLPGDRLRSPLLPLPPKNIFEAFPDYEKWWPSWDPRRQLNCLLTSVASAKLTERIEYALASSGSLPSASVQKYVTDECRKWNLVWIGKNKVAPLEPHEMECLLGFPRDHTRGVCKMERYWRRSSPAQAWGPHENSGFC